MRKIEAMQAGHHDVRQQEIESLVLVEDIERGEAI
jgi:hypothetical protein